ncbi:hypothetical protein C5Y97_19010 [Blastopirellula marina]|uniref:Uncharacterized protein n=1 Tax=Blastopirellula marina TaxID=124 RepID=A0A2S8FH83_9BACT|nr:hypothetical protein C5Y98_19000 [Blastopirellula marina]PTL42819.1 hypothetical protein C5Y97_19010 [Blastopirellula marina]
MLLLGPLLALGGSIGLLLHGSAILEVLLVLTYRMGTPTTSLESLLQNVQLVILFFYLLMVGLILSIVALSFPGQPQYATAWGKLLGCLAALTLIGGGYLSGTSVMQIQKTLEAIATNEIVPKQVDLERTVATTSSELAQGTIVYLVACVILLLVGLIGFRQGDAMRLSSGTRIVVSLLLVTVVAIGIVGASGYLWYNVDQVMYVVTDINSIPEPQDILSKLVASFQADVVLHGGISGLGLVCLLAYLLAPRYRKTETKPSADEAT